jgi:hypothetical protein
MTKGRLLLLSRENRAGSLLPGERHLKLDFLPHKMPVTQVNGRVTLTHPKVCDN